MSGTQAGGINARETNKRIYGDDFYSRIGAMGGSRTHADGARPKGFAAMDREKVQAAGAKGGARSRRGKVKTIEELTIPPTLKKATLFQRILHKERV